MKKSKYNEIVYYPPRQKWLLFNFYTDNFLLLSDAEKDQFEAFPAAPLPEPLQNQLSDGGFLTDIDELEALRQLTQKHIHQPCDKILKLTLCPTMDCNFDCIYCLEEGQKFKGKMSAVVQADTVKFVSQLIDETGPEKLCIVWYGGEPLLALDVIEKLSKQFLAICVAKKIEYNSTIVTNGYLFDAHAMLRLVRSGIRSYRITIDGTAATHDKRRMLKGGAPTYAKIMENLKGILTDNTISIRCNVSRSNMDSVKEFVAEIEALKKLTGNKIKITYAKMLVSRHVPRYLQNDMLTEEEFADFILSVKEENSLANGDKSGVPCAGCERHDYCIDSLGDIYKCNAFLTEKEHRLANVSDLPKEEFLFKHPESVRLRELAFPTFPKCLECKLLPRCYGSCPLDDGFVANKYCDRYRLHTKELLLRMAEAYENGGLTK